jgi:hypothetical protein
VQRDIYAIDQIAEASPIWKPLLNLAYDFVGGIARCLGSTDCTLDGLIYRQMVPAGLDG